ncbi:methyltransferase [Pseudonocardia alaniniphila]|uniref:Methyltransferase n=1 Tax=Pseudonocardia alaniniphila TaxID=75291 RepID=A0ABS9T904_9PSEU|nr:methyltransferase [Pseudonocardia alaniniphila]MCH6164966.1 methyltransferase [Pseudonocardia alaniniphila]
MHLRLPDITAELATASGVFGAQRVDPGTLVLLRHTPRPAVHTSVVDLGAGYGPIAVTLGRRQPRAGVWAVDVNERALGLVRLNAATLGVSNVIAAAPEQVPAALRFDGLFSNPPIKVGKEALHRFLLDWLARLVPGGAGWLVVKQAMGADSLHTWLDATGYPTRRAAAKQGYRLLQVHAPTAHGRRPPRVDAADLGVVGRDTGGQWTVLGHLAGGGGDPVHLLGRTGKRAVLKIKGGAWWADQLTRMIEVVERLRAMGYPTPAILATGHLDRDRSYLLTEFRAGRPRATLDFGTLQHVLDAVDLHARVHPAPVRDWSTMITAFLNGGIAEFAFHPTVLPLARQALGLITRPVPALPTGDFVHGDLTLRNMLFRRDRLSAVIDLEGFGRGTRVIDLVALLQTPAHPVHGNPAIAQRLKDHAISSAGHEPFVACVVHRVLAALAAATECPDQLPDARQRAHGLLRLLD